jgi:hypothetical protein
MQKNYRVCDADAQLLNDTIKTVKMALYRLCEELEHGHCRANCGFCMEMENAVYAVEQVVRNATDNPITKKEASELEHFLAMV